MRSVALLLLTVAVAQASVSVIRTSNDGQHPSTMEIEVHLPHSDRKVRISLSRRNPLEDVPMTVVEHGVSRTFSARQVHNVRHSHYRDVDSKSVVSVREVNGKRQISGHVMHEGVSYFLEPMGESQHKVTPGARIQAKGKATETLKVLRRRKRQTATSQTTYTVELHLLLDSSVWLAFKQLYGTDSAALTELHYYYTHILNGIDTALRNMGTPSISVSCIGITISKSADDDEWMPRDTLNGYTIYYHIGQFVENRHFISDHVMAFTRRDLRTDSNTDSNSNKLLGLALVPAICGQSKISLTQDKGLHSWNTAAHELGHSLGAHHDSALNCSNSDKYLLSSTASLYTLSDVANSIRFSDCSKKAISKLMESLGANNCLLTTVGSRLPEVTSSEIEGVRITLNQVCRLSVPNTVGKFIIPKSEPATICARIHCEGIDSGEYPKMRAPVGTPCGSQKTCTWDGSCTHDPAAPAINETCFWGDRMDAIHCAGLKTEIIDGNLECTRYDMEACCKTLAKVCKYYHI